MHFDLHCEDLHLFAPLQLFASLQPDFALHEDLQLLFVLHAFFSVLALQPAALQPFAPWLPANAGAAENAPIARIPAKAAVANFLFVSLLLMNFPSHVIIVLFICEGIRMLDAIGYKKIRKESFYFVFHPKVPVWRI